MIFERVQRSGEYDLQSLARFTALINLKLQHRFLWLAGTSQWAEKESLTVIPRWIWEVKYPCSKQGRVRGSKGNADPGHHNSHLSAGCGLLHSVPCRRDGHPCTRGRTAPRLGQVQLFILCVYYQEGLARAQRHGASSLLLWSGSVPLSLSPSGTHGGPVPGPAHWRLSPFSQLLLKLRDPETLVAWRWWPPGFSFMKPYSRASDLRKKRLVGRE